MNRLPLSPRMLAWLGLCALIVILDQASKWIVLDSLQRGQSIPVTGFFQLVLVFNPGAAFSFLSDQSGWQRWFFIAVSLLVSAWLLWLLPRHQHEKLMPAALSLIIGGALGNVIDRFVHGEVVDFLFFHIGQYGWPAFNIADSAISIGIVLMIWATLTHKDPENALSPKETSS